MKTNRTLRHCSFIVLGATACFLGGCSVASGGDGRHAGDIQALRADPSPAMHTLGRRSTDRENNYTLMRDTNFRMIKNDMDRTVLYTDRPSHLAKFPSRH